MPIYEYQCNNCGKIFEKVVRFTESDLVPPCPACESQDLKKKIFSSTVLGVSSFGDAYLASSDCGSSSGFS